MFILILALLFGIAVIAFTVAHLKKIKKNGGSSKLINILKLVVFGEAVIYTLLFVFVFIKTLIM